MDTPFLFVFLPSSCRPCYEKIVSNQQGNRSRIGPLGIPGGRCTVFRISTCRLDTIAFIHRKPGYTLALYAYLLIYHANGASQPSGFFKENPMSLNSKPFSAGAVGVFEGFFSGDPASATMNFRSSYCSPQPVLSVFLFVFHRLCTHIHCVGCRRINFSTAFEHRWALISTSRFGSPVFSSFISSSTSMTWR